MRSGAKTYRLLALTAGLGLFISATGCGMGQWAEGLPSKGQLEINLKGSSGSGQSLVGDESERAGFYEITYDVTRGINLMVIGLLDLTRHIVESPPSEQPDEDHAVWGPSEPKGLERLQYKATAERVAEGEFKFALLARDKGSDSEEDYGEIYTVHYFRAGADTGHGEIHIDRDQHKEIDPQDSEICETGTANISFANDGSDGMKIVDVDFTQLDRTNCDDNAQLGMYHYAEAEDGSGDFSFSASNNMHDPVQEPAKTGIETLTIRSQWTAEGAGRSDVIIEGDDIAADLASANLTATSVTATQCWDSSFISRYENTDPEELQSLLLPGLDGSGNLNDIGDEASCPFEFADPEENMS